MPYFFSIKHTESISIVFVYCFFVFCRIMSHQLVTVLVTDGDVRSLQAALWHGKPAVVLPTSPDQVGREADIGLTCLVPMHVYHGPPLRAVSLGVAPS